MKDSAGTERTEEEVLEMARRTADYLTRSELLRMVVEASGGVEWLPADMTRCDCHDLWYDACEAYA